MWRSLKRAGAISDADVLDAMLRFHIAQEQVRDAQADGRALSPDDLPYPWNKIAEGATMGALGLVPGQDITDAMKVLQGNSELRNRIVHGRLPMGDYDIDLAPTLPHWAMPEAPTPATLPPRRAHQILCLIYSPERLEDVAGTMEELFHKVAARHGPGYAHLWYWVQVGGCVFGRLRALIASLTELVGLKRT